MATQRQPPSDIRRRLDQVRCALGLGSDLLSEYGCGVIERIAVKQPELFALFPCLRPHRNDNFYIPSLDDSCDMDLLQGKATVVAAAPERPLDTLQIGCGVEILRPGVLHVSTDGNPDLPRPGVTEPSPRQTRGETCVLVLGVLARGAREHQSKRERPEHIRVLHDDTARPASPTAAPRRRPNSPLTRGAMVGVAVICELISHDIMP